MATHAGEQRSIRLPDSTLVTLGPASALRYRMSPDARDMVLEGLAAFRVQHDPARPFTVRAGNATTTDIGTEFTVRGYAGDSSVVVGVTAGEVALSSDARAQTLHLREGDVGAVSPTGTVTRMPDAAAAQTAWLSGTIVFENKRLGDVALELGRWFGVSVRVNDPRLAGRRVTAQYVQPTLDDVLSALRATLNLRATRNGATITLTAGPR